MIQRDALIALRERVVGATGADRELGFDVLLAILDPDGSGDKAGRIGGMFLRHGSWNDPTSSIDAAVRLVERALPGWGWDVTSGGVAEVQESGYGDMGSFWQADAASPALAIVLATIDALLAQDTVHD